MEISDWLAEVGTEQYVWYAKRLTANDTQANGSHQAGPHISKSFLFEVLPEIRRTDTLNPRASLEIVVNPDGTSQTANAIYYNNRFHGPAKKNGRNEARITGLGGSGSALLDADKTGALSVFAFQRRSGTETLRCRVWVCRNEAEEEIVEDRIGPVEPGVPVIWPASQMSLLMPRRAQSPCALRAHEIPPEWLLKFPSGDELVRKAIERRGLLDQSPDARLLTRRKCEFEIFLSVERAVELPNVQSGFPSVEEFIAKAQSVLQRRKSRAGRSLELHAKHIFVEESLEEGLDFSAQPESEANKKPDFLFPSQAAYKDSSFPADRLRMLAVKTTCKDRWRQVVKEADRIERKHLLTLQEGVSRNQFQEMKESNVQLVVPRALLKAYPSDIRPEIQTFESFINEVRILRSA